MPSTSPSVYVIYSDLQATVSATGGCDSSASGDPVGPSYAAKTIGYSSRFLAYGTVADPGPNCDEYNIEGGFHTIDFSDLYYTSIVTSTVSKAGCPPYANPRLSLPTDLTDVVPAWQTCQPLYYGAFDPPSVLTKSSRLAPAQADPAAVTPTPSPVPALPAVAQATPAAQTPAATIAPNNNGQKEAAADSPASVIDTSDGILLDGNTHERVATPAASPEDSDPDSQEAGATNGDPSGQLIAPAAAVVANSPAQSSSPGTDPNSQKAAAGIEDPNGKVIEPAAAAMVNSPVEAPASAANVVVAHGTTLTENGPPADIGGKIALYSSGSLYVDSTPVAVPTSAQVTPANVVVAQGQTLTEGGPSAIVGGKAAVYSAGSIYLDSSTPVAVPKAQDTNVVVAQGQTLTENGSTASIGGKAAVYSAGSIYYDSTPIPLPTASLTNIVVAQGKTLTENGPSAVVGGKTALYKAGSIYYDSTPVAVPTLAQGQQTPPPVVAAGVTFAPTVQGPSPVVANGITFAPAVEKASPVVAGGVTFAPTLQTAKENVREPVVAGGITFQPSHVQSPNAVTVELPAPLSVGGNPVLKAPNGGLIVAGTTISPGSTTSLLGHVIEANSDNVVLDGATFPLAPVTAYPVEPPTATPFEIANRPVLKAPNGALVIAGSTVSPGSKTSLLGHAISVGFGNVVVDGTTHAFGPVTAHPLSASATPEPLFVEATPSAEEYVLNGKTATAAAPSDVPVGGLTVAGFGGVPSNGSTGGNFSVLPTINFVNGTGASTPTSKVGSPPGSTTEPGSKASPSRPLHGTASRVVRVMSFSWNHSVVLGYLLAIALIM